MQRETSVSRRLVVSVCPYEDTGGPIEVNTAEELNVVLLTVLIFAYEVNTLTFHTSNNFGFDADQSCQAEETVLVVFVCV